MNIDSKSHLQWCRERAIEYVDRGELDEAIASLISDLNKHPQTKVHPAAIDNSMVELLFNGALTEQKVIDWIAKFT